MNRFAIMLNENGSILNGQGIKICSGNNGSSFLANFKRASVHGQQAKEGVILGDAVQLPLQGEHRLSLIHI